MIRRRFAGGPRTTLALGVVAACLALASSVPTYAQSATTGLTGGWLAGPDAAGNNTYVGRLETPRAKQNVADGANLLVSGWAADTTATGWSGFDQVQIYNGDRTKGGTKLADGTVGLARPDIGDVLGSSFGKSGFSAVVRAGALPAGADSLYVYLHTPDKGWWYKTTSVTQAAPVALQFPTDPIVDIFKPNGGQIITTKQFGGTQEYVVSGFALDRNPQSNPSGPNKTNSPFAGPGNVGIQSVTLYIDLLPGQPGYNPDVNLLQGQSGGPASPAVLAVLPNDVRVGYDPCQFRGASKFCQSGMSLTANYGPNYTFSGWVSFLNQRVLQPDSWHTLYAVALSSVTPGKTSTASATFYLKSYPSDHAPCSLTNFLRPGTFTTRANKCQIITG
ncbi:MAG: hypothetical protein JOZ65_29855 [Chloroflexi bacterium]|nr:hypothetical protein [Chloroflexota bacterium]